MVGKLRWEKGVAAALLAGACVWIFTSRDSSHSDPIAEAVRQSPGRSSPRPSLVRDEAALAKLRDRFATLSAKEQVELLDSSTLEEVKSILEGFDELKSQRCYHNWIATVALTDPSRAALLWESMPPGKTQLYTFDVVGRALGKKNPEAAIKFALLIEDPSGGKNCAVLQNAFEHLMKIDPDASTRLLGEVPAGPLHDMALSSAASWWVTARPTEAMGWATNLPAGDRPLALSYLAPSLAETDPIGASALITSVVKGPPVDVGLSSTAGAVARIWGGKDPVAAIQWADTLPSGGAKAAVIGEIAGAWMARDAEAATAWIESIPDRDSGILSLTRLGLKESPMSAMNLVSRIQDPSMHEIAMTEIIYNWSRQDPVAASQAVSAADIPEPLREKLIQVTEDARKRADIAERNRPLLK